jgi:hypothetical protein
VALRKEVRSTGQDLYCCSGAKHTVMDLPRHSTLFKGKLTHEGIVLSELPVSFWKKVYAFFDNTGYADASVCGVEKNLVLLGTPVIYHILREMGNITDVWKFSKLTSYIVLENAYPVYDFSDFNTQYSYECKIEVEYVKLPRLNTPGASCKLCVYFVLRYVFNESSEDFSIFINNNKYSHLIIPRPQR